MHETVRVGILLHLAVEDVLDRGVSAPEVLVLPAMGEPVEALDRLLQCREEALGEADPSRLRVELLEASVERRGSAPRASRR